MNPMMEAQSCPGLGTTRVKHSVYRNKMDKEEFFEQTIQVTCSRVSSYVSKEYNYCSE